MDSNLVCNSVHFVVGAAFTFFPVANSVMHISVYPCSFCSSPIAVYRFGWCFPTTTLKWFCQPSDALFVRCDLLIAVSYWFHKEGGYLGCVAGRRPLAGFPLMKYYLNSSNTLWSTSGHSRRSSVKELTKFATGTNANASSMCVNYFTVVSSGSRYCSCSPSSWIRRYIIWPKWK